MSEIIFCALCGVEAPDQVNITVQDMMGRISFFRQIPVCDACKSANQNNIEDSMGASWDSLIVSIQSGNDIPTNQQAVIQGKINDLNTQANNIVVNPIRPSPPIVVKKEGL